MAPAIQPARQSAANRYTSIAADISQKTPAFPSPSHIALPETPDSPSTVSSGRQRVVTSSSQTTTASSNTSTTFHSTFRPLQEASIFLANLPVFLADADLELKIKETFQPVTNVLGVKIVHDARKISSLCAFVQCESVEKAQAAIAAIRNPQISGVPIRCEIAKAHRSLLVSFRNAVLQDGGKDIECIRIWKERGIRGFRTSFNNEARNQYFQTKEFSWPSPDSIYGQGVLVTLRAQGTCREETLLALASPFGPLEYVRIYRSSENPSSFVPHPAPLPPLGADEISDDHKYRRDICSLDGPWELKFERREDSVAAFETLRTIPSLNITRTHQHIRPTREGASETRPSAQVPQSGGPSFPMNRAEQTQPGRRPGSTSPRENTTTSDPSDPQGPKLSGRPLRPTVGLGLIELEASAPVTITYPTRSPPLGYLPNPDMPDVSGKEFPQLSQKARPKKAKGNVWSKDIAAKIREKKAAAEKVVVEEKQETSSTKATPPVADKIDTLSVSSSTSAQGRALAPQQTPLPRQKKGPRPQPKPGVNSILDKSVLFIAHPKATSWTIERLTRIFYNAEGFRGVLLTPEPKDAKASGIVYFDTEDHAARARQTENTKVHFGIPLRITFHRRNPDIMYPTPIVIDTSVFAQPEIIVPAELADPVTEEPAVIPKRARSQIAAVEASHMPSAIPLCFGTVTPTKITGNPGSDNGVSGSIGTVLSVMTAAPPFSQAIDPVEASPRHRPEELENQHTESHTFGQCSVLGDTLELVRELEGFPEHNATPDVHKQPAEGIVSVSLIPPTVTPSPNGRVPQPLKIPIGSAPIATVQEIPPSERPVSATTFRGGSHTRSLSDSQYRPSSRAVLPDMAMVEMSPPGIPVPLPMPMDSDDGNRTIVQARDAVISDAFSGERLRSRLLDIEVVTSSPVQSQADSATPSTLSDGELVEGLHAHGYPPARTPPWQSGPMLFSPPTAGSMPPLDRAGIPMQTKGFIETPHGLVPIYSAESMQPYIQAPEPYSMSLSTSQSYQAASSAPFPWPPPLEWANNGYYSQHPMVPPPPFPFQPAMSAALDLSATMGQAQQGEIYQPSFPQAGQQYPVPVAPRVQLVRGRSQPSKKRSNNNNRSDQTYSRQFHTVMPPEASEIAAPPMPQYSSAIVPHPHPPHPHYSYSNYQQQVQPYPQSQPPPTQYFNQQPMYPYPPHGLPHPQEFQPVQNPQMEAWAAAHNVSHPPANFPRGHSRH